MINDNTMNCVNISEIPLDEYYLNENGTMYYSCNNTIYQDVNNCKLCLSKINCTFCQDNFTFVEGNKSICIDKEDLKDKYIQDPLDNSNFIKCGNKYNNCYTCNDTICLSCKEESIFINNNPFYQLIILQVRIINNLLKIFIIISTKIKNPSVFRISIDLYKYNNIRNLQESSLKDQQVGLYLNGNSDIEPGKIYELTSQNEFSNSDRVVVNIKSNSDYEMKVLNNNNKILDSQENEKMIQTGEIFDLSKNPSNYQVNNYIIESSSTGCNFILISKTTIKERNQKVSLNFIEKENTNNNVIVECILSNENNNRIPCSLNQNINKNFILDSYPGSSNNGIFYIIKENTEQDLQLNCQIESRKKSDSSNNTLIIIFIILGVVLIGVTIIMLIIFCKKKEEEKIYSDKNKVMFAYEGNSAQVINNYNK